MFMGCSQKEVYYQSTQFTEGKFQNGEIPPREFTFTKVLKIMWKSFTQKSETPSPKSPYPSKR